MNIEDLKIYLPKYLSSESDKELFKGLKDFPENIDSRLYTKYLEGDKVIYQGDGLSDMLIVNLPETETKPTTSMIISNTCDIDPENQRLFPSQIVYSPIISLKKYRELLLKKTSKKKENIDNHIEDIKKQKITQVFFLPQHEGVLEESIVFLDRVCNCASSSLKRAEIPKKRVFTLSDYGAYLFLLKLSIHFTRIKDEVERRSL